MSPLSIIFISPVKVISSELGEKYAQIKHRLQAKTVLNKYVVFDVRGQHGMDWKKGYELLCLCLTETREG